ncbi:MAG TPA: 5'/3'-nucleotidase SurE [Candidatus Polarisedimenticolaceae bacterium]|nr:5'/3'-nucleotidase SurE [Candidatus Polarisedimenticolaceae bacterium]
MTARAGAKRILVTNDDGIEAPGLAALAAAVAPLGHVIVVAPDRERSGAGHALTLMRPLRIRKRGDDRHEVDGTPTDCVHLGVFHLTGGTPPDLIVSGINRGLNIGDDVTYSGTVAAALEGTLLHIPSIAFSVERDDRPTDFGLAASVARRIAERVLETGLPPGVLLNVNVPREPVAGIRITRQGTRSYRAAIVERLDPSGRPYFWIASPDTKPADEPEGDHAAIRQRFVSITPLHANMTHEPSRALVASWGVALP